MFGDVADGFVLSSPSTSSERACRATREEEIGEILGYRGTAKP